MKVLVIEDSQRLRISLGTGLRKLGCAVDLAEDGKSGKSFALGNDYDVIILDLMLPTISGLQILRELRDSGMQTPVLILSAKDQVDDRVRGLEQGADDYLVKPFSFDELQARIQVLVRRRYARKNPTIKVGPLTINTALHEVSADARRIALTPTELSILEHLALNAGRVVAPQQLYEQIYDSETYVSMNAVEAHISTLRRKLREAIGKTVVKTRRGFGYYVE